MKAGKVKVVYCVPNDAEERVFRGDEAVFTTVYPLQFYFSL